MSTYTFGSKIQSNSNEYNNDSQDEGKLSSIVHEPYVRINKNQKPDSVDSLQNSEISELDIVFASNTSSIYDSIVFPSSIEGQSSIFVTVFDVLTTSVEFIDSSDAAGTLTGPIFVEWKGNLLKYTVVANEPSSPSIETATEIHGPLSASTVFTKSTEEVSTTTDDILYTKRLNYMSDYDSNMGTAINSPQLYGYIDSLEICEGGTGISLTGLSSLSLEKATDIIDSSEFADATIDCELGIDESTIDILGGFDYEINDTFVVSDGTASVDGVITVVSVDGVGAITSTIVTTTGKGFVSTPTVAYNGTDGNGAIITINDSYTISSISLDTAGTPYKHGIVSILIDGNDSYASAKVKISNGGKYPVINENSFKISDVDIIGRSTGYNGTTSLKIVNTKTDEIKDSSFVTVTYEHY
jgi:hypothetical protein